MYHWHRDTAQIMMWLIHITILFAISWLYQRKIHLDVSPIIYWCGLAAKLSAGICLGFIFSSYYAYGDTFDFFHEAKRIADLPFREYINLQLSPSDYTTTEHPRVLVFSKILSVFVLLTGGSYWISSLYFSLASFFASWYLIAQVSRFYPGIRHLSIVCFLFIPSIVFWSSGILKDALAFTALSLMVAIFLKWHHTQKLSLWHLLLGIASLLILLRIKHYLLITFLIFLGLALFYRFWKRQSGMKWAAIPVLLLMLFFTGGGRYTSVDHFVRNRLIGSKA